MSGLVYSICRHEKVTCILVSLVVFSTTVSPRQESLSSSKCRCVFFSGGGLVFFIGSVNS